MTLGGPQRGEPARFGPAPPVAWIEPSEEEMVPVRRAELRDFAKTARRLKNPLEAATAWAFTWLGVGLTAGLSLASLYGSKKSDVESWVLDAHWVALVVGVFLAAFCGWYGYKRHQEQGSENEHLAQRIEAVDKRAPAQATRGGKR